MHDIICTLYLIIVIINRSFLQLSSLLIRRVCSSIPVATETFRESNPRGNPLRGCIVNNDVQLVRMSRSKRHSSLPIVKKYIINTLYQQYNRNY